MNGPRFPSFFPGPQKAFSPRGRLLTLLQQLVLQEIRGRYLGSMLGLCWLVLIPVFTLALYTVVFGIFMKARWGAGDGAAIPSFALMLFPGLLVFNYFSECVNRAPSLITNNPNYVKKVVFPLSLLGLVPVLTALVQFFVGLLVWCVLSLWLGQEISWRIVLIPVLLLPFMALVLGIVWILAALGVYVRDLISLVPIVTQVLMFLSPVLYPIENVPPKLRYIFLANPLTFIVEQVRAILMSQASFPWTSWLQYSLVGFMVLFFGFNLFKKLRPGFADVI